VKILIIGDMHITSKAPERRLDNYFETILDKLEQAIDYYYQYECSMAVQVGDFFDSPDVSNYVIAEVIEFLKQYNMKIYCIFGQHDIVGHSGVTLKRSPLRVLVAADVVDVVRDYVEYDNVRVYGSSFGQDIPIPIEGDYLNVLLIHDMIADRPLYSGHTPTPPGKFLRRNSGYSLICCGDYHYYFVEKYKDRYIVNPGALVRKTISKDDLALHPSVCMYDTEYRKLHRHYLTVKEPDEVFDMSMKEKKDNKELLTFIESIRNENQISVSWQHILEEVYEERKTTEGVKEQISKAIVEVRSNG